ncbi:RNA polymerase sigma factor [Burkholderia pseudomallei]|uniref:RNA polymerase sigma factor n=1 Tax=Burkholderia pseudomallei TaxID=28450 RepID=UPI0021F779D3|nr:hypothetical protein [Burkholderia pseudomallei]MCW0080604.1 hypothetical protein [Burkholderia pseudomallei]
MKGNGPQRGTWSQPSPRAEMLAELEALDAAARAQRLSIGHDKKGHIDDEVVVTAMLRAWQANRQDAGTYASEVLRRVTKQVRAHVRKNPGWQSLGGGSKTAAEDFCQSIVLNILEDAAVPCHAEQAFGNFVYRRCLDEAAKLYAKKHSAGVSLDVESEGIEAATQDADPDDLPAASKSPEQVLIEIEEYLVDQQALENIRRIVQDDLPEKPKLAFTFRFFGNMKIESKKSDEVTVTSLMGVTEKTATKYINQAIEIIKQRLEQ